MGMWSNAVGLIVDTSAPAAASVFNTVVKSVGRLGGGDINAARKVFASNADPVD